MFEFSCKFIFSDFFSIFWKYFQGHEKNLIFCVITLIYRDSKYVTFCIISNKKINKK